MAEEGYIASYVDILVDGGIVPPDKRAAMFEVGVEADHRYHEGEQGAKALRGAKQKKSDIQGLIKSGGKKKMYRDRLKGTIYPTVRVVTHALDHKSQTISTSTEEWDDVEVYDAGSPEELEWLNFYAGEIKTQPAGHPKDYAVLALIYGLGLFWRDELGRKVTTANKLINRPHIIPADDEGPETLVPRDVGVDGDTAFTQFCDGWLKIIDPEQSQPSRKVYRSVQQKLAN